MSDGFNRRHAGIVGNSSLDLEIVRHVTAYRLPEKFLSFKMGFLLMRHGSLMSFFSH